MGKPLLGEKPCSFIGLFLLAPNFSLYIQVTIMLITNTIVTSYKAETDIPLKD
jgi:hypothetical protein